MHRIPADNTAHTADSGVDVSRRTDGFASTEHCICVSRSDWREVGCIFTKQIISPTTRDVTHLIRIDSRELILPIKTNIPLLLWMRKRWIIWNLPFYSQFISHLFQIFCCSKNKLNNYAHTNKLTFCLLTKCRCLRPEFVSLLPQMLCGTISVEIWRNSANLGVPPILSTILLTKFGCLSCSGMTRSTTCFTIRPSSFM